jgi:transposase-like protein
VSNLSRWARRNKYNRQTVYNWVQKLNEYGLSAELHDGDKLVSISLSEEWHQRVLKELGFGKNEEGE